LPVLNFFNGVVCPFLFRAFAICAGMDLARHFLIISLIRVSSFLLTTGGKLIFHVFGALAEFERDIIRERTMAGLKAARSRGRRGGRPRVMDDKMTAMAKTLMEDHSNSVKDVCQTLGVSRSTLYRCLRK
jgi:DNA invertase Pin-like site-specific DNA recombinase